MKFTSDARSAVAEAKARFDATMAKSDALDDADATKGADVTKNKVKTEEARLNARARLVQASANLYEMYVASFGAARQSASVSGSKPNQLDVGNGGRKLLKRKMPAPK